MWLGRFRSLLARMAFDYGPGCCLCVFGSFADYLTSLCFGLLSFGSPCVACFVE